MKIVISHDIDHLGVKEHLFKDLIVPKYIFWSILELVKKKISYITFYKKMTGLFKKNAWSNLKELLEFDKQNGLNPTFFVAVNKGKGLSYSLKQAEEAINVIKKYGFDVGIQGICYNDYKRMKEEYETFKKISGMEKFGIKMHYLRLNEYTLKNLAKAGYLFDTTILSNDLEQEYNINGLTEIPFHIMDSYLLGPHLNFNLQEVKDKTIELLNRAEKENKKYFAVLSHQRHFNDEFPQYKDWYIWFIRHCKEKGYIFSNCRDLL